MKIPAHRSAEAAISTRAAIQPKFSAAEDEKAIVVPIRVESRAKAAGSAAFGGEVLLRHEALDQDCWLHGGLNE